ncbi:hypothetical protein [Paludibacterium purpuratum]|uniref:Uncharacterized protein n=1 Tax=Paludibacterium purpuratum TaxID=1144873 RepID=A0A4R7AX15_9NEIS|nr:hypothetical protein [Paludibacterium purpuratum]TDR72061.1 hypothetical protein DFP86_11770 [Paludibacterium purpuratum]
MRHPLVAGLAVAFMSSAPILANVSGTSTEDCTHQKWKQLSDRYIKALYDDDVSVEQTVSYANELTACEDDRVKPRT